MKSKVLESVWPEVLLPESGSPSRMDNPHLIVGIGASAGGLQAIQLLFQSVPDLPNMSFIVVQHLSPDHRSLMQELISRRTSLPVVSVECDCDILPNHIYLNSPGFHLVYQKGRLLAIPRDPAVLEFPVDRLLYSLAEGLGREVVAIILSGTGTDGTLGARAIKDGGGLIVAQVDSQAQFDGMPRSVVMSGVVDYSLRAEDIYERILSYQTFLRPTESRASEDCLGELFRRLQHLRGVDFSGYKRETLLRRVERRLALLETVDLKDYCQLVQNDDNEARLLFQEFLIGVTRFFRDPPVFEVLAQELHQLLFSVDKKEGLRCWVVGCSTGEEAYSLAILICELMESANVSFEYKIFASDIDPRALEIASKGLYPESILEDLGPAKLEKYFSQVPDGYQISRQIRDRIIFVEHNVLSDPPFPKVHLALCRNVLIYFGGAWQRRALTSIHFGIRPGGLLVLGTSESVGEMSEFFVPVDLSARVFRTLGVIREPQSWKSSRPRVLPEVRSELSLALEASYRVLIDSYCPSTFLVTSRGELLHILSDSGSFLHFSAGELRTDLPSLLPPSLAALVLTGLNRLHVNPEPITFAPVDCVRDQQTSRVKVALRLVRPRKAQASYVLVTLEELTGGIQERERPLEVAPEELHALQRDLELTQEQLESTVEQLEAANEELQATNEELQSSNEQLMAANEELQAVNEELHSVNSEHRQKIDELSSLNAEVEGFLAATGVATILIDGAGRIHRFSPSVKKFLNVIASDIGRPIHHITQNFVDPDFHRSIDQSILSQCLERKELNLSNDGRAFVMTIQPFQLAQSEYKHGVLLHFNDNTPIWIAEKLQSLFDSMGACLAVLNQAGEIVQVNKGWLQFASENRCSRTQLEDWLGVNYLDHLGGDSELGEALRAVLDGRCESLQKVYPCDSPEQPRLFMMNATHWDKIRGAIVLHTQIKEKLDR